MSKFYNTALTIAGTDTGGGAGIQADIKTFSALGCYAMSVITTLTAQNTQGVQAVYALSTKFLQQQLESIFTDISVNAVKTGMLHNKDIIKTISEFFAEKSVQLIIDPVMTAKDGSILLEKSAIRIMKEKLLPLAALVTPNIPEAELLLECTITTPLEMKNAAKKIAALGPKAVLIKGGHLKSDTCKDYLYLRENQEFICLENSRIHTVNTHGTGCTLSAAITAYLAKGLSLIESVKKANHYLHHAIQAGADYRLGKGHGPVHHFYDLWEKIE